MAESSLREDVIGWFWLVLYLRWGLHHRAVGSGLRSLRLIEETQSLLLLHTLLLLLQSLSKREREGEREREREKETGREKERGRERERERDGGEKERGGEREGDIKRHTIIMKAERRNRQTIKRRCIGCYR